MLISVACGRLLVDPQRVDGIGLSHEGHVMIYLQDARTLDVGQATPEGEDSLAIIAARIALGRLGYNASRLVTDEVLPVLADFEEYLNHVAAKQYGMTKALYE